MKSSLGVCLLLFTAVAGADEPDKDSIAEPTELGVLASDATNVTVIAGGSNLIESAESSARLAVVDVLTSDGKEVRGVRLSLRNASHEHELYLDSNQITQLRDEFVRLDRWYPRSEKCEAKKRCVHGIARCRPSQPIRQAFCPGFFSTPSGEQGVIVSTLRKSFLFPSVSPSVFISVTGSVIDNLK